jgi:hypothetical protein
VKLVDHVTLGWDESSSKNNSIDSLRFRSLTVDLTNGRGQQVDLNWDFNEQIGSASYSYMQTLPAFGPVQLYPLAGLGFSVAEQSDGYNVPSSFAIFGIYGNVTITDNIWVNYNPMYLATLGGAEALKDTDMLTHELAISYQLNPIQNIRLFANWNEYVSFSNGDFRLEFNH